MKFYFDSVVIFSFIPSDVMATRQPDKVTNSQSVASGEGERDDEVDETQPEEERDEDNQSSGDELDARAMVEELLRSVVVAHV